MRLDERERWRRIEAVLDEALELPEEERSACLDQACAGDAELRAEVEALLAADRTGGFLEVPAGEFAATLIDDFEAAAEPDSLDGRRLGPYEVVRWIGDGGMGVVYEARDTRLDRKVAIKLLPHAWSRDPQARERFAREARAASALDHPNICSIYDIGETEGLEAVPRTFIVMAFYDGETLERKLERGPMESAEAREIAVQVARGLERAHAAGIVHRDVKPANVMVTGHGEVKILDFGIAKVAGDAGLTRSGVSPGTPAYMSPEQSRGEQVDGRTDVWSLGAILYQMLAGRRPFPGKSAMAVYFAIQNEDPGPLPEGVPEELARVVTKALAKDPETRYPSVAEMLAELDPTAMIASPPSRRAGRGTLAVALAGLLALGGFWAYQRGRPELPETTAETAAPVVGVVPFVNRSGDEELDWFGEGLARLVVDGLSSSRHLQVVSAQRTGPLADIERPAELARRAAEDGIEALISGEILPAADGLTLAARVVRTGDGVQLAARRLGGLAPGDLLRAADDVVREARKGLGVPPLETVNVFAADFVADNPAAYEHYVEGLRAWDAYRFEEAARAFAAALEAAPGFTMARYRLALARMMAGQSETARSDIGRALSEADGLPDREARYVRAADAYIAYRDAEAFDAYRQIIERYPYETEARYWLAELLHSGGEYRQELEVLGELAALEPENSIIWSRSGYAHLALGDFARAIGDFQRYLEVKPDANGHDSLADAYRAQGELERAAEHYAEALRLDPTYHFATVDLATVDALRGRWLAAEERLADLVSDPLARPRHRNDAAFELAFLYRAAGRFRETAQALAAVEDLLAAEQVREAWALSVRGTSLMELGQVDYARTLIDRALELRSDRPTRYLFARGLLELRQEQFEELEATIGRILEAAPTVAAPASKEARATAYLQGLRLLAQGHSEAAVSELLQAVVPGGTEYRDYRLGLARAYAAAGNLAAAGDAARRAATERDPGKPRFDLELDRVRALLVRARIAAAEGRPAEAARQAGAFLDRWSGADPGLAELLDARLLARAAQGEKSPSLAPQKIEPAARLSGPTHTD